MNWTIGLASAVLLLAGASGIASAQNPTACGDITPGAGAQAESGTAQMAASGLDQIRQQHEQLPGFCIHGSAERAESGRTAPGTTVDSGERIGAEPTGVTPPVPTPAVGSTGGSVPDAH